MKIRIHTPCNRTLLIGCGLVLCGCFFRCEAATLIPAIASLVLAHLVADFPLQINKIYYMKTRSLKGLALHVGVHLFVTCLVIRDPLENWPPLVLIGLAHFAIDKFKSRWKGPVLDGFLLDQLLHVTSLTMIMALFPVRPAIQEEWLYPALAYAMLPALLMGAWVVVTEKRRVNRVGQWMRYRLLVVSQIVGLPLAVILFIAR